MKRCSVANQSLSRRIVINFDWLTLIFAMISYGLVLLINREEIWIIYNFVKVVDSNLEPVIFSLLLLTASTILIIGKVINNNKIIGIGLAISSFAWALHALLFLLAIPTNGIWILSLMPLSLSIKQAIKE